MSGAAVTDRSPVTSSLEKIPEGQKLSRYVSISHRPEKGWDQAPPHSGETDDRMEWSSPRQHPGVEKVGPGAPHLFPQGLSTIGPHCLSSIPRLPPGIWAHRHMTLPESRAQGCGPRVE